MTHSSPAPAGATRRTVVATAGAASLAAVLAACGGSGGEKKPDTSQPAPEAEGSGTAGSTAGASGKPNADEALARTADIPVGGGKVFPERKVVVTQPAKGQFKAFSAVCTHQGCLVKEVANGTIACPCHNSTFSVTDGSVRGGPATKPLPPERISVSGDSLTLG